MYIFIDMEEIAQHAPDPALGAMPVATQHFDREDT
jgi:hypothetical protein